MNTYSLLGCQPYRDVFLSMREAFLAHDAEVNLAVALPPPSSSTTTEFESVDNVEEFFSNHNFEYVDVEDVSNLNSDAEEPQFGE
jgi:hypothetical protein